MYKQLLRKRPANRVISVAGFEAAVRYSVRRKTLTIKIEEGRVQVQAPSYIAMPDIERFVQSKSLWIQEKLNQQQALLEARKRHWRSGELLPLLGQMINLYIEESVRGQVRLEGDTLVVGVRLASAEVTERRVQKLVEKWYKARAAEEIDKRVAHWQAITGITAASHCSKTYKARWGSCNHRKELSFNWKLIMAPPAVIDYVVVHELCHIIHFNHSTAFWRLVAQYQPEYQEHKKWLRQNGLSLEL